MEVLEIFEGLDINSIVNILFMGAVAWLRSIEIRLRNIPHQTIKISDKYSDKLTHRIERLEDKLDSIIGLKKHELKNKP